MTFGASIDSGDGDTSLGSGTVVGVSPSAVLRKQADAAGQEGSRAEAHHDLGPAHQDHCARRIHRNLLEQFRQGGSHFALVEEADKAGEATSRRIFKLEDEVEQQLKKRGMTIVENVDLAAFRKAGEKAYEVLGIIDAKNKVHAEIGK